MRELNNYTVSANSEAMEFKFYAEDGNYFRIIHAKDDVEVSSLIGGERDLYSLSVDGHKTIEWMDELLDKIPKRVDSFLKEVIYEIRERCYGEEISQKQRA